MSARPSSESATSFGRSIRTSRGSRTIPASVTAGGLRIEAASGTHGGAGKAAIGTHCCGVLAHLVWSICAGDVAFATESWPHATYDVGESAIARSLVIGRSQPSISASFIATARRGSNIGTRVAFDSAEARSSQEPTVTDIAAQVRDILVFHLGVDERRLSDETRLAEDLGADSLDIVETVMSCEERFEIAIQTD